MKNVDSDVVRGFGKEWRRFDQQSLDMAERRDLFKSYFSVFPWEQITPEAVGFDAGCGTGRWALLVAPRVGHLHCVDPSDALDVAVQALGASKNCTFHRMGSNLVVLFTGGPVATPPYRASSGPPQILESALRRTE